MKWLTREQLIEDASVSDLLITEGTGLLKFATVERDALLGEARRVRVVCSTSAADRENDVIAQSGWQLRNYQKNPVVLFGHDYRSLPVGKAVQLHIDGDRLVMETEFATADENPFADVCYKLVKGGYLNAVSVGFRPLKWNFNEERRGIDFQEQELLEISWVPVPAHPLALVEARDAGIDISLLKDWAGSILAAMGEQVIQGPSTEPQAEPEPEIVTLTLDLDEADALELAERIKVMVKQGRVLSAANESKIRSAVASLSEVLSALETATDDGKAASQQVQKDPAAPEPETIDLDNIKTNSDDLELTPEDETTLRATIRALVAAELTPLTGRVV